MSSPHANAARLGFTQQITALLANIGLGIAPSVAFFAWVERNCTLPSLSGAFLPTAARFSPHALDGPSYLQFFRWPWVYFPDWNLFAQLAWNAFWFVLFAAFHSVFAQPWVQRRFFARFPVQTWRTLYLSGSGLLLVMLMALWQNTGRLVWVWPTSPSVGPAIYLFFMSCCVWQGMKFDGFQFVGIRQIFQSRAVLDRPAGMPELKTTGAYAWVRHPIYFFTLLAFSLTPMMSVDRLWVLALTLAYLCVGVPIEERKLIEVFGDSYRRYREKVPAFIPFI